MSKTKGSVASLLIIVAFLALTAIAAVLYGGNAEQKAKMENNFFWQKTRWALDLAFSIIPTFISLEAKNGDNATGSASSVNGNDYSYDPAAGVASDAASSGGFLSSFTDKLKAEWSKGATDNSSIGAEINNTESISNLFDWQTTDTGGVIIFRRKNGAEYKLPIPFRMFGNK